MATGAKSKRGSTVVWGLLVLLILGLGGFGVDSFSGSIRSIGTVGDREISVTTYARAMQQEIASFSQQIGTQLTFQQAQALGLDRSVRAKVVTGAALDNETVRLGVSVGDAHVREALLEIPAFRGLDGNFDRLAYAATLERNQLNEADFEAQIREEAARNLLQGAIVSGVVAPDSFTRTIYSYVAEQRGFTLVRLDATALAEPVGAPDEAAIKAYYDAHPEEFTLPEAKQITYAKLLPEMLLDKVTVDEEALQKLYNERISEFVQPERRLVERLVFASEADATTALAAITAGETTFEALVTGRGLVLSDIDLGDVGKEDLGAAGEAVFGLTEPGVVGPFASDLGPALFRMNAVLAAQETTLDQAREGLMADLSIDNARRLIGDQISDIDDRLAGGATLEDLANETDMELGSLDYFAGVQDPIAAYTEFRAAADGVTAEDFPEVISLDDGGIVVLRLDGVKPPTLQALDVVRSAVVEAWTVAETQKRLLARAEQVKTALLGGATAESLGLTGQVIAPMTRDGVIDEAPETLVASVFDLPSGGAAVIEAPGAVFVAVLGAVVAADPADPAPESEAADLQAQIKAQAAQAMAQDLFSLYSDALETEAGIALNEAAINAVHAQFQ